MMYQAIMNIGGSKPKRIATGVWETSDKVMSELRGMTYGRIPKNTAWSAYLIIRSSI